MKMDGIISEELIENTYLFCRKRINDSEAAKDLSHDIILCALAAIRKGKSFTDFYGWYWRMARNKYADYLKARKMLPVELNMGVASDMPEPIEALISEEEISALNYSLSRLSSINRETVIKYYLKEQTIEEIARALNVPVGTVKRSYRITALYLLPEEAAENYPYKGIGWSNEGQRFLTAQYGYVEYLNLFDAYPFIEKDGGRLNRCGWIDGGNVSLLIALSENPSMELNANEQEQAAVFIEHGLVKKTENGLKVLIPIMSNDVYAKITEIIRKNIKPLAEEYGKEAGGLFVDTLLPYVRKDLISNFLYWDVKIRMQEIPALFYYGIEECKTLKLPQDYTRSAAGLLITRNKA